MHESDSDDQIKRKGGYREEFEHFETSTDLHGWQYLKQKKGLAYRWLWGLVIFSSIVAACVILCYAIFEYRLEVTEINYDVRLGTADELYFPTVTVCNMNQIRRSFVSEFNLSNYQLTQVKRLLFDGAENDMTESELATVREVASLKEIHCKAQFVNEVRKNISSWKEYRQVYEKVEAGLADKPTGAKRSFFHNIHRLAVQDLGEETFLWASYKGMQRNPEQTTLFFPFYPTDYGRCSLIHPMIAFDQRHENTTFELLRQKYAAHTASGILFGRDNGLTFLVDAETYDYGYAPQTGQGFKIAVTPYRDIPIMQLNDIDIEPGTSSQVSIVPTITVTTQRCRDKLTPDERKCYFQDEFRFENFVNKSHRYSLRNCLQEAMETAAYEKCGCDFFSRKDRNQTDKSNPWLFCMGKNLTCFKDVRRNWGKYQKAKDSNGEVKECLPSCSDQTHILTTTTSFFPAVNTFADDVRDFCTTYLKIKASCSHPYKSIHVQTMYGKRFCQVILDQSDALSNCTEWFKVKPHNQAYNSEDVDTELKDYVYRYSRDNIAKVSLFFNEPVIKKENRDVKISLITFLGTVGGIMGLAMGASIITLFEVVYHFCRFVKTCGRRAVKEQKRITSTKMRQ